MLIAVDLARRKLASSASEHSARWRSAVVFGNFTQM